MLKRFFLIATLLSLSACVSQDGVGEYRVASIGNAQRTVEATILSTKPVMLIRSPSGAGANAGGLLGAAMAAESSDNAAVIVAGLIGGVIIGNNIENSIGSIQGFEYLIQTQTGKLITVAQPSQGNDLLMEGNKALLIYGYPHRLVKDPR